MRHAIIMAGGSGTRFWPASRENRPKQFLSLADHAPLLRVTFDRVADIVPPHRIWIATGARHVLATQQLIPELATSNIVAEPCGRDTAACVALAAARLLKDDTEATCLVLPADHVIGELDRYRSAMTAGLDHVSEHGGLLTFGIKPERPETGYGYLKLGSPHGSTSGWAVHRLERFVEKPDAHTATELIADGVHLWNSGMFAWRASDLLEEVHRQLPELAEGIDRLSPSLGTSHEDEALTRIYPKLPRTSVDYGVMEGAVSTWTIPVDFPWSDVGSWPALRDVLPSDTASNSTNGPCVAVDATDNVIVSEGPTVAIVGASELVVVATQDAVLVVPIDQAQRVKEVVAELRKQGRTDLL